MEIRINKEIRQYTESVFFGLSLRQFFFSALAVASALGLYFLLSPVLGAGAVSWVCILGAVPFAVLGFFRYNGMAAEQAFAAFLRSEILGPKKLVFRPDGLYREATSETLKRYEKEMRNVEKRKDQREHGSSRKGAGPRSGEEDLDGRDLSLWQRDVLEELEVHGYQLQGGGKGGQGEDVPLLQRSPQQPGQRLTGEDHHQQPQDPTFGLFGAHPHGDEGGQP